MRLLIVTQAVDSRDPVLGFFIRWIEEFANHCERVEVICLTEGTHDLPANVRVHSLGKERGHPLFGALTYLARFKLLAWRLSRDYDTVFVHMNPEYLALFGPIWRLMGKRVALWYTHKSVTLTLRIAVAFANVVFTASRESFCLPTKKLRIVGHGIDVNQFSVPRVPGGKTLRILTAGRLSATKRVLEMLTALDVLAERGEDFSFTVAGAPAMPADAAYERQVREAAIARPYAARVRFLGGIAHDAIPALLAAHDVFLNLSATGSMDKAVLEALVAGVPAVTTNVAFRELLAPSGLYVESGSPDALADALVAARTVDLVRLTADVRERYALPHAIEVICAALGTAS
ncbi:MAG TPA: glycosyltransferase family 4 protein [Candidatus Paceibacterota bacterium]|nr:glycosyltransferase family 4 protein [Candidatus Paceibacterota bacterium]